MASQNKEGKYGYAHINTPAKIDLEALLKPATVAGTMQELIKQLGLSSNKRSLEWISMFEHSGLLAEVEEGTFSEWVRKGNISYAVAEKIESAVNLAAGTDKPHHFLTRFYAPRIKYPSQEKRRECRYTA